MSDNDQNLNGRVIKSDNIKKWEKNNNKTHLS